MLSSLPASARFVPKPSPHRLVLFDVMDTLVVDPFFLGMEKDLFGLDGGSLRVCLRIGDGGGCDFRIRLSDLGLVHRSFDREREHLLQQTIRWEFDVWVFSDHFLKKESCHFIAHSC